MEYIYAAMILHSADKDINEENVKSIIEAAGIEADDARIKALIAALEDVDIDEAMETTAMAAAPAAAAPAAAEAAVEEEEEEEVHSYQYITPSVSASDSGSKIERIIGRRVLPNTKEAEEIMRRSRYAIVSKNERIHSRAFIAITLQNRMMLV